ncbi:MAG: class I SAM-dependent methyltransferase [Chitinophagaceae bacterium]|nr:class I SAM-dependent methyltransferase [Chitinophagaceae bacterium]
MTKEEIIDNYLRFDEDSRLKNAFGRLEEQHTQRLILRHIPFPRAVIFDIGAGTGPYSVWLAAMGYQVHYSDIVPHHVALFESRHGNTDNIVSIGVEDARNLRYRDNTADLVLLNGPLYHLPAKEERLQVLREAGRVLKPGGRLLGFTISRFAGLHYALSSREVFNDDYFEMVLGEVRTGFRDNRNLKNKTFISAYFHLQEEIEDEFRQVGLQVTGSYGVLGPAGNMPDLEEVIKDEKKKERLLLTAELMEQYPMQSHKIMTVGIK